MMRRLLLVLGLVIVVSMVSFVAVLKPQRSAANEAEERFTAAVTDEVELRGRLESLRALDQDEVLQTAWRHWKWLPDSPALPRLVDALQRASILAGVDLRQIAPSTPTVLEDPRVRMINVSVQVNGPFPRIREFARLVENIQRAIEVTSISLTPQLVGSLTHVQASVSFAMYSDDAPPPEAATVVPTPGGTG